MLKRDDILFTTGFILLLINLFFIFFLKPLEFEGLTKHVFSITSLLIRIFVTIWLIAIAKIKNRKEFCWGVFAFFIPSIALIAISFQKRPLKENKKTG